MHAHASTGRARLSELDPDLTRGWPADVVVPVFEQAAGDPILPGDHDMGLLLVRGMACRRLSLLGSSALVPVWTGDVLAQASDAPGWLDAEQKWTADSRVVLADLGVQRLAHVPGAAAAVLRRAGRLHTRVDVLHALAAIPRVEERLLGLLLMLAEEHGRVTGRGVELDLPYRHRQLGEMIGAARPTVTLASSNLIRSGLLERGDPGVWILSPEAHRPLRR